MQSYNPLDTVIFALSGVLADVDLARTYAAWGAGAGIDADAAESKTAHLVDAAFRGELDGRDFLDEIAAALGGSLTPERARAGWLRAVSDPYPGIVALVERLSVSLRVVAVSNLDRLQLEECERRAPALFDPMEAVFPSFGIGAALPDEVVFESLLGQLAVDPAHVAYFDHSPAALLSATSLGIRSFEAGDADTMGSDLDPLIDSIPDSG